MGRCGGEMVVSTAFWDGLLLIGLLYGNFVRLESRFYCLSHCVKWVIPETVYIGPCYESYYVYIRQPLGAVYVV